MAATFLLDPARTPAPDPELAELLRQAHRSGHGPHRARMFCGELASSVTPNSGVQPGIATVPAEHETAIAELLAAAVGQARAGGHAAAERLAGVLAQWREYAGIPAAEDDGTLPADKGDARPAAAARKPAPAPARA